MFKFLFHISNRVNASEQVLIGDFGLARDIYHQEYYRLEDKQKPLPFKWMAIESIEKKIFSIMSDVVSIIDIYPNDNILAYLGKYIAQHNIDYRTHQRVCGSRNVGVVIIL